MLLETVYKLLKVTVIDLCILSLRESIFCDLLFFHSDIAAQNEQYEYEIEFSPRFEVTRGDKDNYNKKDINERIQILYSNLSKIIDKLYVKSFEYANEYPIYTTLNVENDVLKLFNDCVKQMFEKRKQEKVRILNQILKQILQIIII